jgi:hypothetical protein
MPRQPVNFKRSDLQRAIRAAREENLPLHSIEIDKRGHIIIHASRLELTDQEAAARQAWMRATEEITAKPPPEKSRPTKKGKHAARTSR